MEQKSDQNLLPTEDSQRKQAYDWENFRPSALCAPFKFTLQLVFVGCCGSLLFGYNVANLNTAIDMAFSEYQICGAPKPFASHLYQVYRQSGIDAGWELANAYPQEAKDAGCKYVVEGDVSQGLRCDGGHTDFSCPSVKWYRALLQSAIMIFGTFGALLAGKMINMGRRAMFIMTSCTFLLGIICSLCANSFPALFWARLLVGLGVGMVSVTSPTYISEMTPRDQRGKYGVLHQLSITVGIFVAILLGLALPDPKAQISWWEPDPFSRFWWRFMVGLGIIPVVISLYLLVCVYTFDTPVYYAEQHCYKDSKRILQKILDRSDVAEELNICLDSVRKGEKYREQGLGLMNAMKVPEFRHVILVGVALSCFQQIGGINVFMTSSTSIFEKAGLTPSMQVGMSVIMGAINMLMTFPTIALIERLGRRTALLWGSLLQFVCVVPSALANWIDSNPEDPAVATQILAVIAVMGFVTFFAVAFGPIVWVYLFEIYPMDIKDAATSVATAFNWVAAIIIVFVANILSNRWSFVIFTVIQGLATLFIYMCIKETKGLPLGVSPYISRNAKEMQAYVV